MEKMLINVSDLMEYPYYIGLFPESNWVHVRTISKPDSEGWYIGTTAYTVDYFESLTKSDILEVVQTVDGYFPYESGAFCDLHEVEKALENTNDDKGMELFEEFSSALEIEKMTELLRIVFSDNKSVILSGDDNHRNLTPSIFTMKNGVVWVENKHIGCFPHPTLETIEDLAEYIVTCLNVDCSMSIR